MDPTGGRQAGEGTDPLVGALLDARYLIDAIIARGGMATVYAATDTRLDRTVAVKVMRPLLAEDPDFVERFAREARAAARLSSPEVVAVHDQGTDAATGTAYLVMEYIAGGTLRDLVREHGALPPDRALDLLEPVLRALAAAHAAGLVHRDVKPENVLLGDDGRVKVTDFGLARAVETSNLTATTGFLMGTMAYLAPEQVEQGRTDTRTDVYAAGILLWELLTGAPPYVSESPMTVAFRHVHEDVPAPGAVVAGIPAALDELVVRATRRDAAARPVDAGAFLAELRAARAHLSGLENELSVIPRTTPHPTLVVSRSAVPPGRIPPGSTHSPPTVRPPARHSWLRPALGVLVLCLLAAAALAGGWYLGAGRYTEAPPVLGLTRQAAVDSLVGAGLDVAADPEQRFSEDVAAGSVLAQTPAPGEDVRKGSAVTLVLSRGPDRRAVPELIGSTQDQATAALTGVGLRVGAVSPQFSARDAGTVLDAEPPAGAQLAPDTPVALVVSKGVEMLAVPDVRGKPRTAAGTSLQDAGFKASVTEVFSDSVAKDLVLDQSPSSGRAPRGSTVALQVSKGPEMITIPDVVGQPRRQAEQALKALGLEVRALAIPGPGTVRSTDPGAGEKVRKGAAVTIYVF
ncbi:MAG: Stk1 family PASTA domain-containing Ser/Thr kinase [Mycobacteriales bacterium]